MTCVARAGPNHNHEKASISPTELVRMWQSAEITAEHRHRSPPAARLPINIWLAGTE